MTIHRATIYALVVLLLGGCGGTREEAVKVEKQGQIHYEMGVDALRKNNLPIAFRELLKAQSFQPERADIKAALALAWRYRGDLAKSQQLYRQALRIHPTPAMHNNYGNLLLQMGNLAEAEREFRLALNDPRYTRQDLAFINLGDTLAAEGKYDEAIASYRKATLINPKQRISQLHEAEAFISSHRAPYAEALLLTMLRRQPDNRAALATLLPLLRRGHDAPQATELLHRFQEASKIDADRQWAAQQLQEVKQWHE